MPEQQGDQQIQVYVYQGQNYKPFSAEQNKNLYSEIRQFLTEREIVIIYNDQLCTEHDTFAHINNKHNKEDDKEIILNVFTIPEIMKLRVEINRLTQIEVKEQQQQNDIIELQNSVAQLQNQIHIEINRSNEMGLKEYQYQNQIKQLEEQVKVLQEDKKEQPLPYNKSRSFEKTKRDFIESCIIIDDQRKIVAHEYIFQLIQKKQQELESLEQSQSQILSITNSVDSFEQSTAIAQKYCCHFCNLDISEDVIQLSCLHCFHDQCFDQLLQGQINQGSPYFSCLCSIKLKPKEIFSLSNQYAAEIYKLQMLQLQLKKIKESNFNLHKCPKKYCTFFYYYNVNLPQKSYCPSCLE